jgi:hypothetical protein
VSGEGAVAATSPPRDESTDAGLSASDGREPSHIEQLRRAAAQGDEVAAGALKLLTEWRRHSPIPSETQLNAMSDEHEAAWAGVPASKRAATTARLAYVPRVGLVPLVRRRDCGRAPRSRRVRTGSTGCRSPGRSTDGDDEPADPLDVRAVA